MSLADNAKWKNIETKIADHFKSLSKHGVTLTCEVKRETFEGKNLDDVANYVWSAAEGIQKVVQKGQDEKAAVSEKIKGVRMEFGTPGYKMDGSTFAYTTDLGKTKNAATTRDDITHWIMNNL